MNLDRDFGRRHAGQAAAADNGKRHDRGIEESIGR
jgi:hypothetical protein